MNIYRIKYDSKSTSDLGSDCSERELFDFSHIFDNIETQSFIHLWNPPPFYHLDELPSKYSFLGGMFFLGFAIYDHIKEDKQLHDLLCQYGELLPIACSDTDKIVYQYHCMNCLGSNKDFIEHKESALWVALSKPEKMAFRKSQMPDRGLFWLRPGTNVFYTVENEKLGVEHNFKMLYEARGYTGLDFVEAKLI